MREDTRIGIQHWLKTGSAERNDKPFPHFLEKSSIMLGPENRTSEKKRGRKGLKKTIEKWFVGGGRQKET